jgi:hypothetical protein
MLTRADSRLHHEVYTHKQYGKSHNVIKKRTGSMPAVEIICLEGGTVKTR